MTRITAWAIGLLFAATTVSAQQTLSPKTAIILHNEVDKGCDATAKASRAEITADARAVMAYITADAERLDRKALETLGVQVTLDLGDILTARIPTATLAKVAGLPGVTYVQVADNARQMLDVASSDVGIDAVRMGETPCTGKGVIVGIVDAGFDYGHAAFRDADGTLRIRRVWEQQTAPTDVDYDGEDELTAPALFNYGTEFATPEAILAAGGDIPNNTHGTHVTCCAAGSSPHRDGTLRGMAPDADIVLVSMREAGTNNVNISNAIAYIFAYADEVHKPCVVNLSLGTNAGPHDGTSPFDLIADRLQGPGRIIVGAAGNNRKNVFHIHRERQAEPLRTFIKHTADGEIEVWADAEFNAQLLLYKNDEVTTSAKVDRNETSTLTLGRNVTGSFTASYEVNPLNQRHHLMLKSEVTNIRNGYHIALEITPSQACTLDIRADGNGLTLTSNDKAGFAAPSADDATICEIGGTARRITTVGAYATRVDYQTSGDDKTAQIPETTGALCSFSSCGPTDDGRMKPDITAPGAYIAAATSRYDNTGSAPLAYVEEDEGGTTYKYGYMQGTSMSSPIVAGIVACWLEACQQLTPEQLAQVLAASARHDSFTGTTPSNQWGHGKIDAAAGLHECQLLTNGIVVPETSVTANIYNIAGQRVATTSRGRIYIQNGRKIIGK